MRRQKLCACIALILGISLMAYAGGQLAKAEQIYQEGNVVYDNISGQVRKSTVIDPLVPQASFEAPPAKEAQVNASKLEIDFEALNRINKDAVAWLYCPDTIIDYPVMKAGDYSYYLNHLPDGSINANGSLFIDYNCAADFSEQLTVIYGHHMKSKRMFGSLKGYKNQEYYEEHPFMYLYTKQETYRIELIYSCVISAGQWRERAFMCAENIDALIAYAANNTTFVSGIKYEDGDRVVALSTCSYEFDDARHVVIGILTPP
jgi:sortase B